MTNLHVINSLLYDFYQFTVQCKKITYPSFNSYRMLCYVTNVTDQIIQIQ